MKRELKKILNRLQTETGETLSEALAIAVNRMLFESWEAGRNDGYQDGYSTAEEEQCRAFSAAMALTLHEDYGFTREQCIEAQNACNGHTAMLNDALIQRVLDELLTEVHDESEDSTAKGVRCTDGDNLSDAQETPVHGDSDRDQRVFRDSHQIV